MLVEKCILTIKDMIIIEGLLDHHVEPDDPVHAILTRKIRSAQVVFGDDIASRIATVNSRVDYSIDGRTHETRILSQAQLDLPVGLQVALSTPKGAALVGLSEGQAFCYRNREGAEETLLLERVLFQPEAASRLQKTRDAIALSVRMRPPLRVIGGKREEPQRGPEQGNDRLSGDPRPTSARW